MQTLKFIEYFDRFSYKSVKLYGMISKLKDIPRMLCVENKSYGRPNLYSLRHSGFPKRHSRQPRGVLAINAPVQEVTCR